MSEVCPNTGQPCPLDVRLQAIKQAYEDEQEMRPLLSLITMAVRMKRENASCEGMVTDLDDLQHCGSQAQPEMQSIASRMGEECGFEEGLFEQITVSRTR